MHSLDNLLTFSCSFHQSSSATIQPVLGSLPNPVALKFKVFHCVYFFSVHPIGSSFALQCMAFWFVHKISEPDLHIPHCSNIVEGDCGQELLRSRYHWKLWQQRNPILQQPFLIFPSKHTRSIIPKKLYAIYHYHQLLTISFLANAIATKQ